MRNFFFLSILFLLLLNPVFGQIEVIPSIITYQEVAVETDYYPTGDAASANGEADDASTWIPNGGSANRSSVANTDGGGGGSYAVQCNCIMSGFRALTKSVSGLSLTPHTATVRYRITDGTGRIFNWGNVASATYTNLDNTSGSWQVGTVEFTPTTGTISIIAFPCDNDGTATGTIEISEITITEN